jgi:rubrerythrin
MSIQTKEELQYLLHRGLEIEKKFESVPTWSGFISLHSTNRKIVLTLARDSYKHRLDLEELIKKLNLEPASDEITDENFDFQGMMDEEILQKICAQDEMIKDLYTELLEKTEPKLISVLAGSNYMDFFYHTLERLIEDEKRHVRLVKSIAGNITRIL